MQYITIAQGVQKLFFFVQRYAKTVGYLQNRWVDEQKLSGFCLKHDTQDCNIWRHTACGKRLHTN